VCLFRFSFILDSKVDGPGASKVYSGYIEEGALGDLIPDHDARITFLKCGYYVFKKSNYVEVNHQ